jgi:hypothetical protein
MTDDDPFDIDKLTLADDQVRERLAAMPRKTAQIGRRRRKFTMFPDAWEEQLGKVRAGGAVYRVALHLLKESWRSQNNRVKLANVRLKEKGVDRAGKRRALDLLGRLGLISRETAHGKSPVVTVKFTD